MQTNVRIRKRADLLPELGNARIVWWSCKIHFPLCRSSTRETA
jgi:hypothetical protein